jgi:hypothetical protein
VTDASGALIDCDSVPDVYIYDESVSTDDIEDDIGTWALALVGPLTPTRLSTGYYTYTYTVPASSTAGAWHDVWIGQVDGGDNYEVLLFDVTAEVTIAIQSIQDNTMIIVQLSGDITNDDGDETLTAQKLYYSVTYNPMYASPDLVRLEVGRWLDYIPDDTLALMIHWASKEADFIQGVSPEGWSNLRLARTKFVVFDAALRALNIPGAGNEAGFSSGRKKSLGDLSIQDGSPRTTVPKEILLWVQEQRTAWWRVVNAGGNIVPGQGLDPTFAVKGEYDPDRRVRGRLWQDPEEFNYAQPTVNRRARNAGQRRGRWGFYDRRRNR